MSNGKTFKSKYGPESITGPQLLAEIMCEKLAASRKERLFAYFWNDKWWLTKFKAQITHANKLLQEYSIEEILQVLKDPELKKVYSLGLRSAIVPLLDRQRKRDEMRNKQGESHITDQREEEVKIDTGAAPRKPFTGGSSKTNKLAQLRKLSSGESKAENG